MSSSSPVRQAVKKLYTEEPTEVEQDKEITSIANFSKPRSARGTRPERGSESEEEISSPAVKNLKMAKVPLNRESMKSSTKIYLQESAKHL